MNALRTLFPKGSKSSTLAEWGNTFSERLSNLNRKTERLVKDLTPSPSISAENQATFAACLSELQTEMLEFIKAVTFQEKIYTELTKDPAQNSAAELKISLAIAKENNETAQKANASQRTEILSLKESLSKLTAENSTLDTSLKTVQKSLDSAILERAALQAKLSESLNAASSLASVCTCAKEASTTRTTPTKSTSSGLPSWPQKDKQGAEIAKQVERTAASGLPAERSLDFKKYEEIINYIQTETEDIEEPEKLFADPGNRPKRLAQDIESDWYLNYCDSNLELVPVAVDSAKCKQYVGMLWLMR